MIHWSGYFKHPINTLFLILSWKYFFFFNHSTNNDSGMFNLQKDASILAVVGKTFDDLILNSHKNILLEVCGFIELKCTSPFISSRSLWMLIHFSIFWYFFVFKVHTPWCINCDTTSKQMEKLAKHFKGLENLVFARIDASENEHPKLQVSFFVFAASQYPLLCISTRIHSLTHTVQCY